MILHIGKYADPELVGSNRLLPEQVFGLRDRGVDVEVLTWPQGDGWTREQASEHTGTRAGQPYLSMTLDGIPYHVINPPRVWGLRWITDEEHVRAVAYAKDLLAEINPSGVHFHYWHCLWWFMDAAIALDIPILHTAYDYGLACAQTTLVMGDRSLCDAVAEPGKCAQCTRNHPSLKGRLNETVLDFPGGEALIQRLTGPDGIGRLKKMNAMRVSAKDRTRHAIERSERILPQLKGLIVTTPFAGRFFCQFGISAEKLYELPWFYSQPRLNEGPAPLTEEGEVVLAYVGRLSREKGVHLLLEALEQLDPPVPVRVKLTGIARSEYAKEVQARFLERAGTCRVEWSGWVDNQHLPDFYEDVHVAVFPSTWYDNCPTTLIEALAHRKFILCSDVPTMSDFIQPEKTGLLFTRGDAMDLANILDRFLKNRHTYLEGPRKVEQTVRSKEGYLDALVSVYGECFQG